MARVVHKVHAIVSTVPPQAQGLRGEARVRDLSRRAREAASESARVSSLRVPAFTRDAMDRPLATEGVFWGVSHVSSMVAGIVAKSPVAIDVERIRPRSMDQIRAALSDEEHGLLGGPLLESFFRAWTAKEAALKLVGVGISRLSEATISAVPSETRTVVAWGGRTFGVEHHWPEGHVVAVAVELGEVVFHLGAGGSDRT